MGILTGVAVVSGTAVHVALAPRLPVNGARVRSVCGRDEVGFPDIHFCCVLVTCI